MKIAKAQDHFVKSQDFVLRIERPAKHSARADRSFQVTGFDKAGGNERRCVVDDGQLNPQCLLILQIAGLSQHDDSVKVIRHVDGVEGLDPEQGDGHNRPISEDVPLIEGSRQ